MKRNVTFDVNPVLVDYLPYLALDGFFLGCLIASTIQLSDAGRLFVARLLHLFLIPTVSCVFIVLFFVREIFSSWLALLTCFLVTKPFLRNCSLNGLSMDVHLCQFTGIQLGPTGLPMHPDILCEVAAAYVLFITKTIGLSLYRKDR
jgi:hypothetical protein